MNQKRPAPHFRSSVLRPPSSVRASPSSFILRPPSSVRARPSRPVPEVPQGRPNIVKGFSPGSPAAYPSARSPEGTTGL